MSFRPAVPNLSFRPAVPNLSFRPAVPNLSFRPAVPNLSFRPKPQAERRNLTLFPLLPRFFCLPLLLRFFCLPLLRRGFCLPPPEEGLLFYPLLRRGVGGWCSTCCPPQSGGKWHAVPKGGTISLAVPERESTRATRGGKGFNPSVAQGAPAPLKGAPSGPPFHYSNYVTLSSVEGCPHYHKDMFRQTQHDVIGKHSPTPLVRFGGRDR